MRYWDLSSFLCQGRHRNHLQKTFTCPKILPLLLVLESLESGGEAGVGAVVGAGVNVLGVLGYVWVEGKHYN